MTGSGRAAPAWAAPAGMIGLLVASLVVTVGTAWAFEQHAPDFHVFYAAWKLVLEGHGAEIYRESPDRFLYAPGFAWLLSPLALLPREAALALWCFGKAAVVGFLVRELQPGARTGGVASFGMAAWGVTLVARPLLIDFQYGQVNTLIAGACAWALLGHCRQGRGGFSDVAAWFTLAVAAVTKVFPLPLLAVPWLARRGVTEEKLQRERLGLFLGLAVTLSAPVLSLGVGGTVALMDGWRVALLARGLPYESHNQSFGALLHRWFSGELVHVVSLGMNPVPMGWPLLSVDTLKLLSLAWICLSAGGLLAWLMRGEARLAAVPAVPEPRARDARWLAVLVALLVLPSHLVWKPYFVMFLPAAILVAGARAWTPVRLLALAAAFAAMNLVGFDLLGADWGARAEAASLMLWAGLGYLALLGRGSASARGPGRDDGRPAL